MRSGRALPKRIAGAPELQPGLELHLSAFFDLTTCRQSGVGSGYIPWTAVETYADRLVLDTEEREDLHHHIRAMDECYLAHQERKRREKS